MKENVKYNENGQCLFNVLMETSFIHTKHRIRYFYKKIFLDFRKLF